MRSIKLQNISFRYSRQAPWILRDINLEIPKGSIVGFVGTTGSGKSTLVDILMALRFPEIGSLKIDETDIHQQNFREWQSHIAHVPQSIFLADATVAENIAFGLPIEKIDYKRIEKAAQQAQIAREIESLEKGYNTVVGERGLRLSGGQRQRIGIARALYKHADVIFLDEATSALDDKTEAAVMEAINLSDPNLTVILVAHRLNTLAKCDFIICVDEGRVVRREMLPTD